MLIRLLRAHWRPYKGSLGLLAVLQIPQTVATLILPTLNADIIDNGLARGDVGHIVRIGGVMAAVTVVQMGCVVGAVTLAVRTAGALGRDIRVSILDRVRGFSGRELAKFGAPSLLTRTTNDVQQVQAMALATFTTMATAPVLCAGALALAFGLDVPLALVLLLFLPALIVTTVVAGRRAGPLFGRAQAGIDAVNRILREQITGVRVIRAFVRDGYEQRRFGRANAELADVSLRAVRATALLFPALNTAVNLVSVPIVWIGARLIDAGDLRVGTLTAFLGYLTLLLTAVTTTSGLFMTVPRAEVCAGRIDEILRTEPSVAPPRVPVRPRHHRGELELAGVAFGHPGAEAPVLSGIDLVGRPGGTTAILGPTGSGKSTLLGLIARLFDVTAGKVLIDGVDVRDLDPLVLTELVALVPQKAYLFAGTVASNLRYGRPDATDAQLWRALEVAQASDFVRRLPGGLGTAVAQGGTTVSGGQRQRLSIARALVRRPRIYLFDDCFSALDPLTDTRLRAALAEEIGDATRVTVAQRVGTIRDAERIVVLDEGRVVGSGTHTELLAGNNTYAEVVASQLAVGEAR